MAVVIVTGSAGLVGSATSRAFADLGCDVVGIDNDMRREFFGREASTIPTRRALQDDLGAHYLHVEADIRDREAVSRIVGRYGGAVSAVVHTAAQPSHDWASREPFTDFDINAVGTLNVLEAVRLHCPEAPFVFTSTNKVYGDSPNRLPLVEFETRWELAHDHPLHHGIPEDFPVDQCLHSIFGASKVAADVLVQEYGRYFGLKTAVFRGGCLTGSAHRGAELHGFLSYLMRCTVTGQPYTVFGYKGKQVRDNIHTSDLVAAFLEFVRAPRHGEVYNMGGGRESNVSMREAIDLCQEISGRSLAWSYVKQPRVGDHMWWISSTARFQAHYPRWRVRRGIRSILEEILDANIGAWRHPATSGSGEK